MKNGALVADSASITAALQIPVCRRRLELPKILDMFRMCASRPVRQVLTLLCVDIASIPFA